MKTPLSLLPFLIPIVISGCTYAIDTAQDRSPHFCDHDNFSGVSSCDSITTPQPISAYYKNRMGESISVGQANKETDKYILEPDCSDPRGREIAATYNRQCKAIDSPDPRESNRFSKSVEVLRNEKRPEYYK